MRVPERTLLCIKADTAGPTDSGDQQNSAAQSALNTRRKFTAIASYHLSQSSSLKSYINRFQVKSELLTLTL